MVNEYLQSRTGANYYAKNRVSFGAKVLQSELAKQEIKNKIIDDTYGKYANKKIYAPMGSSRTRTTTVGAIVADCMDRYERNNSSNFNKLNRTVSKIIDSELGQYSYKDWVENYQNEADKWRD